MSPRRASIEQPMTDAVGDGLSRAEAFFERVVPAALALAVLPAEPDHLAFDVAVEVEEADARILQDRAEVFDLAPARAVLLDAPHELALHLADLVRVRGIED